MEDNEKKRLANLEEIILDLREDIISCNLTIGTTETAMKRVENNSCKSLESMDVMKTTVDKIELAVEEIKKNPPSRWNKVIAKALIVFVLMDGLAILYGIFFKK